MNCFISAGLYADFLEVDWGVFGSVLLGHAFTWRWSFIQKHVFSSCERKRYDVLLRSNFLASGAALTDWILQSAVWLVYGVRGCLRARVIWVRLKRGWCRKITRSNLRLGDFLWCPFRDGEGFRRQHRKARRLSVIFACVLLKTSLDFLSLRYWEVSWQPSGDARKSSVSESTFLRLDAIRSKARSFESWWLLVLEGSSFWDLVAKWGSSTGLAVIFHVGFQFQIKRRCWEGYPLLFIDLRLWGVAPCSRKHLNVVVPLVECFHHWGLCTVWGIMLKYVSGGTWQFWKGHIILFRWVHGRCYSRQIPLLVCFGC